MIFDEFEINRERPGSLSWKDDPGSIAQIWIHRNDQWALNLRQYEELKWWDYNFLDNMKLDELILTGYICKGFFIDKKTHKNESKTFEEL